MTEWLTLSTLSYFFKIIDNLTELVCGLCLLIPIILEIETEELQKYLHLIHLK